MKINEILEPTFNWVETDTQSTCTYLVLDCEIELTANSISEGISRISFGMNAVKSGSVAMGQVGKSRGFLTNPFVLGIAGLMGAKALGKWKKSKRDEIHMTANTADQQKFYQKMVNDLLGTGQYTLLKAKNLPGTGYEWALKKK